LSEEATLDPAFSQAMNDLGIDPSKLDASEETESASNDMEVEASAEETEGEAPTEGEGENVDPSQEKSASEGEENEATEKVTEEPKQSAKEIQEIQAARQELEAKEQAFMERMSKQEKEFQEKYLDKVKSFEEFDVFLEHLANKDPELFDLVKAEFSEHHKQYSNPVISKLMQEQAELKKELSAFKASASDQVTLTKLDAEWNKVTSTIGKEAEAAGIKIDRQKIEDLWADNPKISLEAATYAIYGASIAKAAASKAKVSVAEKKVAARPVVSTAGSVNKSTVKAEKDFSGMSASDAVRYFAKQLAGKA
jgi:succinate dehydrogenase flavin-adding protein (antitoxin of CptAB toxin-antitoxin module)